jgi:hypothetical protein
VPTLTAWQAQDSFLLCSGHEGTMYLQQGWSKHRGNACVRSLLHLMLLQQLRQHCKAGVA